MSSSIIAKMKPQLEVAMKNLDSNLDQLVEQYEMMAHFPKTFDEFKQMKLQELEKVEVEAVVDSSELEQKIKDQADEIKKLKRENIKDKELLTVLSKKVDDQTNEIKKLKREKDKLILKEKQIWQLTKKNEEQATEIKALKKEKDIALKAVTSKRKSISKQSSKPITETVVDDKMSKQEKEIVQMAKAKTIDIGIVPPLVAASQNGQVDTVRLLIKYGANVNAKDNSASGSTALIEGCLNGSLDIVSALLAAQANADLQDNAGMTALMQASLEANAALITLLLEAGANLELQDQDGHTALEFAKEVGDDACVELLTNALQALRGPELSDAEQVELMVQQHTLDQQDEDGWTPLMRAVFDNNPSLVTLLVKSGANLDIVDQEGTSALVFAAERGFDTVTTILLTAHPNVNLQSNLGDTALMAMIRLNKEVLVKTLVKDHHADIEMVDERGDTALLMACSGHTRVVDFLLTAGAKVNVTNQDGETPLHRAAVDGYHDIVKRLLGTGALVDAQNQEGSTPLMLAVMDGHVEVVKALIEAHANPKLEDENLCTALEIAGDYEQSACVKLLETYENTCST